MHPLVHFIVSAILAAALFPFFSYFSLLALIAGTLIDLDHYILYIIKKRDFNIINCYKYCSGTVPHFASSLFIFHIIEFPIFIFIISLFYPFLFPIFIALLLHDIMDFINEKSSDVYIVKQYSLLLYLLHKFS